MSIRTTVLAIAMLVIPGFTLGETPPVHPEGALRVANPQFTQGSAAQIGGEKFATDGVLELFLVGVAGRFTLGKVTADSVGGFNNSFDIPIDTEVGSYRLIAVATDGDEVATVNVNVLAAPEEPVPVDPEAPAMVEPSAEPMVLDRARSPLVTGGAVVGIVFALVTGGMLLRKP